MLEILCWSCSTAALRGEVNVHYGEQSRKSRVRTDILHKLCGYTNLCLKWRGLRSMFLLNISFIHCKCKKLHFFRMNPPKHKTCSDKIKQVKPLFKSLSTNSPEDPEYSRLIAGSFGFTGRIRTSFFVWFANYRCCLDEPSGRASVHIFMMLY